MSLQRDRRVYMLDYNWRYVRIPHIGGICCLEPDTSRGLESRNMENVPDLGSQFSFALIWKSAKDLGHSTVTEGFQETTRKCGIVW